MIKKIVHDMSVLKTVILFICSVINGPVNFWNLHPIYRNLLLGNAWYVLKIKSILPFINMKHNDVWSRFNICKTLALVIVIRSKVGARNSEMYTTKRALHARMSQSTVSNPTVSTKNTRPTLVK